MTEGEEQVAEQSPHYFWGAVAVVDWRAEMVPWREHQKLGHWDSVVAILLSDVLMEYRHAGQAQREYRCKVMR